MMHCFFSGSWSGVDFKSRISNSVFVGGKDDGIENNAGYLIIENCIFSGYDNEGIAVWVIAILIFLTHISPIVNRELRLDRAHPAWK